MENNVETRASLHGTLTAGTGTQIIERLEKDYNILENKPSINGRTLQGNIQSDDLEIGVPLTNQEIEDLINRMG